MDSAITVAIIAGVAAIVGQLITIVTTAKAVDDLEKLIELVTKFPENSLNRSRLQSELDLRVQAFARYSKARRYWPGVGLSVVLITPAFALAPAAYIAQAWLLLFAIAAVAAIGVMGFAAYFPKRIRGVEGMTVAQQSNGAQGGSSGHNTGSTGNGAPQVPPVGAAAPVPGSASGTSSPGSQISGTQQS